MQKERLDKYYTKIKTREIDNLKINLAQIKDNIPTLKWEQQEDCFILSFDLGEEATRSAVKDDIVEIYEGVDTGRVSSIVVKNVTAHKIENIKFDFDNKANLFRIRLRGESDKAPHIEDKLRKVGRYDIVDRQLEEASDVLQEKVMEATK